MRVILSDNITSMGKHVFNGSNKVETTEVLPTILVEKVAGTEFYSIKFNDEYLGWKAGDKNYFAFSATAPTSADTGFLWSFSLVDGLAKIDLQLKDGTKTRSLQYNFHFYYYLQVPHL